MTLLLTALFPLALLYADETDSDSPSESIDIEHHSKDNNPVGPRSLIWADVQVTYNPGTHVMSVVVSGENDGEVILYRGTDIVGYDCELNTEITVPSIPGIYRVEIIGCTWVATGKFKI